MSEHNDTYGRVAAPCEVGDWVRFYRDARLIIGRVERIYRNYGGYAQLQTDVGEVDARYVVEWKR